MSVLYNLKPVQQAVLGEQVSRATDTLPATTTETLFTVTGKVMLLQIMGEVTTVIQTQACNTKLSFNPTVGAAADICSNLNISAKAVGENFGITGTVATAMVGDSHAYLLAQATPLILPAGVITLTTAATNTGSVKWDLFYIPIDLDATVTAA